MLWVFGDGHHPAVINNSDNRIFCYGYLYSCPGERELNGDIRSYAILAAEFISFVVGRSEIKGLILRNIQERLYVGFTKDFTDRLLKDISMKKGCNPIPIDVCFILKYAYFSRLCTAVNQISYAVLSRLFPTRRDFHAIDSRLRICSPTNTDLQMDSVGQLQALKVILGSLSIDPPILVTGSFGTGKTRLLIRAAHDILEQDQRNTILLCAYQNTSANLLTKQFLKSAKKWTNIVFRYVTGRYDMNRCDIEERFFITRNELKRVPFRVLITTFSTSMTLTDMHPRIHFTHILLDEGAQTREPETIIPLCLAASNTKIVITGDHCQVCIQIYLHVCICNLLLIAIFNTLILIGCNTLQLHHLGWSLAACSWRGSS